MIKHPSKQCDKTFILCDVLTTFSLDGGNLGKCFVSQQLDHLSNFLLISYIHQCSKIKLWLQQKTTTPWWPAAYFFGWLWRLCRGRAAWLHRGLGDICRQVGRRIYCNYIAFLYYYIESDRESLIKNLQIQSIKTWIGLIQCYKTGDSIKDIKGQIKRHFLPLNCDKTCLQVTDFSIHYNKVYFIDFTLFIFSLSNISNPVPPNTQSIVTWSVSQNDKHPNGKQRCVACFCSKLLMISSLAYFMAKSMCTFDHHTHKSVLP